MADSNKSTKTLDDKIKAIENRKKGGEKANIQSKDQKDSSKPNQKKTSNWKIIGYIIFVIVVLVLNVGLQVIEHQTGMRLSRWLTFVLPVGVGYLVLFKL